MRMGPTGTPLIATYHSSLGDKSDMSMGADVSSSRWTLLLNAPASAPDLSRAAGLAAARLVASGAPRGAAGCWGGAADAR